MEQINQSSYHKSANQRKQVLHFHLTGLKLQIIRVGAFAKLTFKTQSKT